jgi:hypothetical protein
MTGYELGMKELRRRKLDHVSYNLAVNWYHSGWIGQDDLDLIIDVWTASPHTFSPTESCKRLAEKRLKERFNVNE